MIRVVPTLSIRMAPTLLMIPMTPIIGLILTIPMTATATSNQSPHDPLVHQVRGWFSGVELKMSRRQGGPSRTGGEGPIFGLVRAGRATRKTANRPRPKGCVENGPATALLVG